MSPILWFKLLWVLRETSPPPTCPTPFPPNSLRLHTHRAYIHIYTQQLTDISGAHESLKSNLGDIFVVILFYFLLNHIFSLVKPNNWRYFWPILVISCFTTVQLYRSLAIIRRQFGTDLNQDPDSTRFLANRFIAVSQNHETSKRAAISRNFSLVSYPFREKFR